nr:MAG TPA: hypothetical protein [Caudoviricetes sp.]
MEQRKQREIQRISKTVPKNEIQKNETGGVIK